MKLRTNIRPTNTGTTKMRSNTRPITTGTNKMRRNIRCATKSKMLDYTRFVAKSVAQVRPNYNDRAGTIIYIEERKGFLPLGILEVEDIINHKYEGGT
jgi:hypothetical protein